MSNDKKYTIGRHRGKFCLIFTDGSGNRRRYSLNTTDPRVAELAAPGIYEGLTRPTGGTVAEVWNGYCEDRAGRAIIETMGHTWKALGSRFGHLNPADISVADCRAHIAERRQPTDRFPNGIHDGTIHTELGHLRMVLLWAEKRGLIERAPHIERPPKPKPSEKHLSRVEAKKLIESAFLPHLKLFVTLALGTGARARAILDLQWSGCDFERNQIDLRNHNITTPHKGRAIVPMNKMVKEALLEAKKVALTSHVIEWAGEPIQSVKKGLAAAATRANIGKVSPHMLRHSAAVHMAEAGISMEEIAQYLGHANPRITRDVYARFSPDFLQSAAAVLDYGD